MAQRRFHYEQAFEHYLRCNRVPYVAVDEARKTLLPDGGRESLPSIKSFDFVVYGPHGNLLIDVKGRMFGSGKAEAPLTSNRRFESWVTQDDVDGLTQWQRLFGPDFKAVFVFAYCLRQQPPDALFDEVFAFNQRWYVLRSVELEEYRQHMTTRSSSWKTVHVPREVFTEISEPFSVRAAAVGATKTAGEVPQNRVAGG